MINELARVQGQNSRARSMKAEATLTLAEWKQTIADFHGLCAYCQTLPFTLLEHFIPLGERGAGTNVNNCLPACQKCNKIKRDFGLEKIILRFGEETIERLQVYLAGRMHQPDEPRPKTSRIPKPLPAPKPKREKPIPVAIPSDLPYLTLEQAAAGLGMSKATVCNYMKDLSIQTHKFNLIRNVYISREDFEHIRAVKEAPWKFPQLIKTR